MSVPTETLQGTVCRQLFHGQPYRVFVEHPTKPLRAVTLVEKDGEIYVRVPYRRMTYEDPKQDTDAQTLTADYLAEAHKEGWI